MNGSGKREAETFLNTSQSTIPDEFQHQEHHTSLSSHLKQKSELPISTIFPIVQDTYAETDTEELGTDINKINTNNVSPSNRHSSATTTAMKEKMISPEILDSYEDTSAPLVEKEYVEQFLTKPKPNPKKRGWKRKLSSSVDSSYSSHSSSAAATVLNKQSWNLKIGDGQLYDGQNDNGQSSDEQKKLCGC